VGKQRRPFIPASSTPLAAQGGIKAQSKQGDFGTTWWSRRWLSVLESFRIGARLARGRIYARQGQVLEINITRGKVTARVQGSRPQPYDVRIAVKTLRDGQWQQLIQQLSGQALFVAKLLAGQMPQDIEQVFTQAKLSLFPQKSGDLQTSCSCPDNSNPCKHIAAVYYLLGEEFERDPFLIFRLRGMDRDQLLARLGSVKPAENAPEVKGSPSEPLPLEPAAFWTMPPLPEDFHGEVQTPPVTAGLVRRLGHFPFWRGEKPLLEGIEPVYLQAGPKGLNVFLGEKV
jgi:uncharacterized Zn finger protein